MNRTTAYLAAAVGVLAAVLASCGGGGGAGPSFSGPITPAPALRTDLLVGYYGDSDTGIVEHHDHANLAWIWGWGSSAFWITNATQHLTQARDNGMKAVLCLPMAAETPAQKARVLSPHGEFVRAMNVRVIQPKVAADAETNVRQVLRTLQGLNLLAPVVALCAYDEPELSGYTDDQVNGTNAMLRRVASEFPELARVNIAVFYACGSGARPGLRTTDWPGCDDYDAGCSVLQNYAQRVGAVPPQRLLIIPGGADRWRQDPACFASYAHRTPDVAAIVSFIWDDNVAVGVGLGIRSNGMAPLYRAMGRTALGRT